MFCARCGQQIPDACDICPLCGRESTLKVDPPPAISGPAAVAAPGQIQWPDETVAINPPARRPDLRGVGGWLLIYCELLTILAPAFFLLFYWFALKLHPRRFSGITDLARVAFGMIVGIFLWARRSGALTLLNIYFLVLAVSIVLFGLESYFYGLRLHRSFFLSLQFKSLVLNMGVTILWFAYFKRSVRVRNTYGRNL
jgi:hypothetical protein